MQRTAFGGYGDVARAFNRVDGHYHSPWVFDWLEALIGKKRGHSRVLEVGSGTGNFCRALHRAGFHTVIGVDPDPRMIEVAEESSDDAVYYCATVDTMGFIATGLCDAVVAHYSFENFGHDERAITEIKRVLRNGGVMMTVTWPIRGLGLERGDIIRKYVSAAPRERLPFGHLTHDGYASVLRGYGFTGVRTRKQTAVVEYTVDQAKQYMRASGLISRVPKESLERLYAELDAFVATKARVSSNGTVRHVIDVIVDTGFA